MTEREEKYLSRCIACGLLSASWTACRIISQPYTAEAVQVSRDGERWFSVVEASDMSARGGG